MLFCDQAGIDVQGGPKFADPLGGKSLRGHDHGESPSDALFGTNPCERCHRDHRLARARGRFDNSSPSVGLPRSERLGLPRPEVATELPTLDSSCRWRRCDRGWPCFDGIPIGVRGLGRWSPHSFPPRLTSFGTARLTGWCRPPSSSGGAGLGLLLGGTSAGSSPAVRWFALSTPPDLVHRARRAPLPRPVLVRRRPHQRARWRLMRERLRCCSASVPAAQLCMAPPVPSSWRE